MEGVMKYLVFFLLFPSFVLAQDGPEDSRFPVWNYGVGCFIEKDRPEACSVKELTCSESGQENYNNYGWSFMRLCDLIDVQQSWVEDRDARIQELHDKWLSALHYANLLEVTIQIMDRNTVQEYLYDKALCRQCGKKCRGNYLCRRGKKDIKFYGPKPE